MGFSFTSADTCALIPARAAHTRAVHGSTQGRRSWARLTVAGMGLVAAAFLTSGAAWGDAASGLNPATGPTQGRAPFGRGTPVIVEGDILVSPGGFRGIGTVSQYRRWQHGEVPYVVDSVLPAASLDAITRAVEKWNAASGITLSEVPAGDAPPMDHLVFTPGTGCASWVGRQGGAQEVWIGPSCTDGSVMHEIGHALGLEHEHTRADRDQYIEILWDNITPEKQHNFAIAPPGTRSFGAYDPGSIMHYGPSNFSVDGSPTIATRAILADGPVGEPVDEPAGQPVGEPIGQRIAPSAGDLASVADLYASDLALSLSVDDEFAVRELTLFVTNQHHQGAHEVWVDLNLRDARVAALDDGWRCIPQSSGWQCHLARLDGNAASKVVLTLDTAQPLSSIHATLNSKTPDLDASNNGGTLADDTVPSLAGAVSSSDGATALDDGAPQDPAAAVTLGAAQGHSLAWLIVMLLLRRCARPEPTSRAGRSAP